MKNVLILTLLLSSGIARAGAPSAEVPGLEVAVTVGGFEEDIADVSAKLREGIRRSQLKGAAEEVRAAIGRRDAAGAQAALDSLLAEFPEISARGSAGVWRYQGQINFWRGDLEGAYGAFDRVVKASEKAYPDGIAPNRENFAEVAFISEAYFSRGSVALQRNLYERALADIDSALKLRKAFYMYHARTQALFGLKRYKEAAAAYDQAYGLNPKVSASRDGKIICAELGRNGIQSAACAAAN